MPRAPRIEYEGARYHVMSRGSRREAIFLDDADHLQFLDTLGETCGRTGWVVHAYVLMRNHYHLLLETPEANLSDGMRWLQGTYGRRYNTRHGLSGHVFEGRFKSPVVDPEDPDYFRVVSGYIHLNPLRARLLSKERPRLEGYRWSSYPYYLKSPLRRPDWLEVLSVLGAHDIFRDDARGRRQYAVLMKQMMKEYLNRRQRKELEKDWDELRRGWYVGSESFRDRLVDRLAKSLEGKKRDSLEGGGLRAHDEREGDRLVADCCKGFGVSLDQVRGWPKSDPRKQGLAWLVKSRTVLGDRWVSDKLNMGHRNNTSIAVRRYREAQEPHIRRLQRKLLSLCNTTH